jgi:signal transduction histidine kinase
MNIRSLYTKWVLYFVVIVAIGLMLAFLLVNYVVLAKLDSPSENRVMATANQMKAELEKGTDVDFALIKRLTGFEYALVDADLQVPASFSRVPQANLRKLKQGEPYIDISTLLLLQKKNVIVGVPVEKDGQTLGLLLQIQQPPVSSVKKFILMTLLFALLISAALIALMMKTIVRPLRLLRSAVEAIAGGHYQYDVQVKRTDELGELADSIRHMAEKLGKIEQMRREFVANVSHDFQTPLTSIRGFSEELQNDQLTAEQIQHYSGIIRKETNRLSRLCEILLQLSSLDSEQHPFQPESYRLDEQIRDCVIHLEPLWLRKQMEWDLELEPVEVQADRDQLAQVWINLLDNAIKFSPPQSLLRIRLCAGEPIVVHVVDAGPGMTEEVRSRLFERFFKGDPSRQSKQAGNGLGMSIVQKIVDNHHGAIAVNSQLGEGTTIEVRLPKNTPTSII